MDQEIWHSDSSREVEMSKEDAQFNDWNAVGKELDDLAHALKNLSKHSGIPLESVKEHLVLEHVFFWNEPRRASFFMHDIQGPLHTTEFEDRVDVLLFIPEKWTQNDHMGLLPEMNKYRNGKNLPDYNDGRNQYVLFVSGSYTHEREIGVKGVDKIITINQPRLCLELVKIVRKLGYPV
ncbi:hypothetical protein C2845_PM11G24460 [Panicum miliaceum]|uniref:Uncharacterized protein n=1 Tax=Panicum miliaceum TaxID=4540 RepID=A0A3L6RSQ5_PANMI|nr:hypothetical protein C2845_PM11G24460 [Panicum miliaceum]